MGGVEEGEKGEKGEGKEEEEEEEEADEEADEEEEADAEAEAEAATAASAAAEEDRRSRAAAVMQAVRGSLLPELYGHLKDPKTEGVRVPVALAVLKLLLLLPAAILQLELRGFLIRVVSSLSSRNKSLRDIGRETLAKVALELGAANFGAVLHEMTTSLKRGYQIQVLGYSVHYVLAKLVPTLQPGDLDYCAQPLVRMLLEDIFGEAAEKKEVDAIATSMKEARASRSFASFELLASVITFAPNINLLVPPIHQRVLAAPGGADSLKNMTNARELLRHIALGLAANSSVELQPLCVYVCGLLATHLPPKPTGGGATGTSQSAARAAPVGSVLQPLTAPGVTSGLGGSPLSHELLAFSLNVLLTAIRKGRFAAQPDSLQLLEPLLPLLQRAMRSDGAAVVSMSLRTLAAILPFPIANLQQHSGLLLERTLQVLRRSANFKGSELVGIGLKVITVLLRKPPPPKEKTRARIRTPKGGEGGDGGEEGGVEAPIVADVDDDDVYAEDDDGEEEVALEVGAGGDGEAGGRQEGRTAAIVGLGAALDEKQLRWMISFISTHLEDDALQGSLFGLLRVLFGRRFVLAEMYDLVLVLGDMVLQAEAAAVRTACSKLYLTFLLHYPLGPKRLQQHFSFLVTNLSYQVPVGRLSLLGLLTAMVGKLPPAVLHQQAELLLVALVLRLVNDDDMQCKVAVAQLLRKLIARSCALDGDGECDTAREKLLKLLRAWHESTSEPALARAAAQLSGIVLDALGSGGSGIAQRLLPMLVASCAREASAPSAAEEAAALLEPEGEEAAALQVRWKSAYYSLKAVEKMAATEPAVLLGGSCEPLWAHVQAFLLHEHAWLRTAASRLLGMLLSAVQPAALAEGGGSVPTYLRQGGLLLQLADASAQQLHSAVVSEASAAQAVKNLMWLSMALLAHPALGPPEQASLLPPGPADAADLEAARVICWPIVALATRLAPLVQTAGHVRGTAVMRWFAAVASQLEADQLHAFLPVLLPPVIRCAEDTSGKVHAAVIQLAQETQQLLQKRAEVPSFVAVYQKTKDAAKAKRKERKERAALEAVADPETAAAKRMATNLGKRKQKKRKLERNKRGRDSGGSIGLGSRKKKRMSE